MLTVPFLRFIVQFMKWKSIIVLLATLLSIVTVPFSPLIFMDDGQPAIGVLDVCHSGTPALASNGDMPCLNECSFKPMPLVQDTIAAILYPLFKPLLLAFQDERPPEYPA
jgi:hypothetical protein